MNIAICDDEVETVNTIYGYLRQFKRINPRITVEKFFTGTDIVDSFSQGRRYDIIFLDIEIGNINGVDVAKKLYEYDETVIIIFISSHTSYVCDAFEIRAFQYLFKPVGRDQFGRCMDNAIDFYNKSQNSFCVTQYDVVTKRRYSLYFKPNEIRYFVSQDKKVFVHTTKGIYTVYRRLDDIQNTIKSLNFIRCHKSFFVNSAYIRKVSRDKIVLNDENDGEIEIPISYGYKQGAVIALKTFLEQNL